jgi:uncharacterized BrkB/YihY/UPF0761 family membrane protein
MAQAFKKFKRFSQQSLFLLLATLMVVLIGIFVVWSIIYLGGSFNAALTVPPTPPPQVQFDIQGFQNLNLNQ